MEKHNPQANPPAYADIMHASTATAPPANFSNNTVAGSCNFLSLVVFFIGKSYFIRRFYGIVVSQISLTLCLFKRIHRKTTEAVSVTN